MCFSAVPFLLLSAAFFDEAWITIGFFSTAVYHLIYALLGGNIVLSKINAEKISNSHELNKMVQNFSCLLGITPLNVKIIKQHETRVFLIERIFSPGYLVFGEKVLERLTIGELRALTYFILHRNKGGEGFLKLLLASTTFFYSIPLGFINLKNYEGLKVISDIYSLPLLKMKYFILGGIFDSVTNNKIDSFHESDLRLAIYKILKLKAESVEEAYLSEFDIINLNFYSKPDTNFILRES